MASFDMCTHLVVVLTAVGVLLCGMVGKGVVQYWPRHQCKGKNCY